MVVYPTVIAPLFNRFQPLEDAGLRERVTALMQRCGFVAKGLFVMDGSRRSAHANAYFTGLGRSKRVVFYDTLLRQLTPSEVEAVLAHELGHFHHRHIPKRMVLMFGASLAGFALLGWLTGQMGFYTGLGVRPSLTSEAPNDALALILFLMTVPLATFFCRRCSLPCRARTNSRPMPTPHNRPRAAPWPRHCSSCTRTMLPP